MATTSQNEAARIPIFIVRSGYTAVKREYGETTVERITTPRGDAEVCAVKESDEFASGRWFRQKRGAGLC